MQLNHIICDILVNPHVASSTFDEIQLANGKVFTDYGRVYDAESSGLLGSFTLQTTSGTTTSTTTPTGPTFYDASLSQVYVLNNGSSYNYGAYSQVSLFSQSDYSNLNKSFGWNIPYYIYTANTTQYLNPHRLTRWGSNGLLLHTKSWSCEHVIIIRLSVVTPTSVVGG